MSERFSIFPIRPFPTSPRTWLTAVLVTSTFGLGLAYAQEPAPVQVQGPFVEKRVEPLVLTTDLRTLAERAKVPVWKPGDPVRVIEDLREQDGRGPGGPTPGTPPVTPQESTRDVRDLPAAGAWEPGDPVRIMGDLREDGAEQLAAPAPVLGVQFDGIPATGFLPPDTVGDVGPNHYVQAVNVAFAIFDKTGNLLAGPVPINSLWSGFGGPCDTQNNGDPIVRYDHLADRWLVSQFALGPNPHECIAISRTPDPVAGGWYLYAFPTAGVFPDYPKIGVWADGYYMGTQRGYPGGGLDVWAFERLQMLVGGPAGLVHFFVGPPSLFLLPSDLDGPAPPAGTPNFFVRQVDQLFSPPDRLEIWAFTVNWAVPTGSFVLNAFLPVAQFNPVLCPPPLSLLSACIPQPAPGPLLEGLTVWTMWRAQFRNFGTHQTIVTNHTVNANGLGLAGVRWYEVRRTGGPWFVFQQGTHSPDAVHRWMGSAAMDSAGNIAAGYSVSSSTVFPGIRAAVRAPNDPPGTLPVEVNLMTGGGVQTHPSRRWGNYSTMDVDDCTFWYTTEYYSTTSVAGWKTRISSFRLPNCGPPLPSPIYQYAAKLICGLQKDPDELRLTRGLYATTINIHNPGRRTVHFAKKLALTFPPPEQRPGEIIRIARDELRDDQALKVDCTDVLRRLFPQGFPFGYIEGFIVVESDGSLDVTGVYSAAALDAQGRPTIQSSLDVESIPERCIAPNKCTCER